MTGQELLTYALEMADTSQETIDNDANAFTAWALLSVNFVAGNLYYYLQSRLPSEERATQAVEYDFRPFDETDYPSGAQDVILFAPEDKLYRVYAKYNDSEDFIKCEKISLNSFSRSPEWFAKNAVQQAPLFTVVNKNLQIFPKPQKTITKGVLVHKRLPFQELPTLTEPILGIPADYQDLLVPALMAKIYQRLRRTQEMTEVTARYEREKKIATKELARRAGDRAKTITTIPVYT